MSQQCIDVSFVASYIPRQCGIATYTNDLVTNLAAFGILVILCGFGLWVFNYHLTLVTKTEKSLSDLDTKIASVEILVTIYELHGLELLSAKETEDYKRVNSRLISLTKRRDDITGVSSD